MKQGGMPGDARMKVHYIAREDCYSPGVRRIEHLDQTKMHAVRNDLVYAETTGLPSWAKDAADYFAAAEKYERASGVVLTEYKFDLPTALPREQQVAIAKDFLHGHLGTNHVVAWAMHEPSGLHGHPHPHVHAVWSAREVDGIERTPQQFFRKPEAGGVRKTPALNQYGAVKVARQTYADILNLHCDRAGIEPRYHPDSLESRGLALKPEPKLFPSDSFAYQSQGVVTERMQALFDHRAKMAPHRAEEADDARQYWEHRKQQLGITPAMSHDGALERIAQARQYTLAHPPQRRTERELAQQAAGIQEELRPLESYHQRLAAEQAVEGAYVRTGKTRSPQSALRVEALLTSEPQLMPHGAAYERTQDLTRRWERPLIGNRVSQIYHTPDHKNYGDVHPKNQVHFWTEQQALDAGFRRATNDHHGRGPGLPMTADDRHAPGERTQPRQQPRPTTTQERVAAMHARQRAQRAALVELGEEDTPHGGVKVRLSGKEIDRGDLSY
jgi:hypothetical protein